MNNKTKQDSVELKTVYTFIFGRNIYTIRLSDIKKITLMKHDFIELKDDTEDITKSLYIFSVIGERLQEITDDNKPIFETIIEVKSEESDYANIYNIYEDLVIKWDTYLQTHKN